MRRGRSVVTVAALVASMGVAGCSSSSSPSSSAPSADEAAGAVAAAFHLSDDVRPCLAAGFSDHGAAVDVMVSTREPTGSQQDLLAQVVEGCLTDEDFATSVAGSISSALPPPDTAQAATQIECLRTAVLALDDGDQRTLMVGLLAQGAPLDGKVATARSELVNSLYTTCGVTVGG